MLSRAARKLLWGNEDPWMTKAGMLQEMGCRSEAEFVADYTVAAVRQATMRTREDIILLVSLLDSANSQLRTLRRISFIAIALLAIIAFK